MRASWFLSGHYSPLRERLVRVVRGGSSDVQIAREVAIRECAKLTAVGLAAARSRAASVTDSRSSHDRNRKNPNL